MDGDHLMLDVIYHAVLQAQPGGPLASPASFQCLIVETGKLAEFAGAVAEYDALPQFVLLEHLGWEFADRSANSAMLKYAPHH